MDILSKIDSPKDLKNLNLKELEGVCAQLRERIIANCANNPGHIGASLGTVELTVALHYLYDMPLDKIVWDVGHQAYSHKILTGRREAFVTNRKYKGISGFPKMSESEYDSFGTGHSSTSISAALGLITAARLQGSSEKVVAVIGDGAMTGGLAYEGLNNAGASNSDILVILNDNQISIDPNVGAMHNYLLKLSISLFYKKTKTTLWNLFNSKTIRRWLQGFAFRLKMAFFRTGSLFESMGFKYFGIINGNDLNQLIKAIESMKDVPGPKLLHIITQKGKGFEPAENNQTKWHSPGFFDKDTGEFIIDTDEDRSKYQEVFGETLVKLAETNEKIVGITPAMATGSSMTLMMERYPKRTFDVGIAEGHAVTFSAGLAARGILPYCCIYSSFIQRAYDNVIHDVAIQNLKVIFCLDRAGLVGEDGATHHGLFDLSAFRPVPNLTIFAPMNEIELKDILYSVQDERYRTTIIRYPKGYGEGLGWKDDEYKFIEPAKARLLSQGEGIGILSIGTVGNTAAEAIEKVRIENGCEILHYDMRFLKPADTDALAHATSKCHTIITVEDGSIIGGLYSLVSEYIASNNLRIKLIGLGAPDKFIEQGTNQELMHEFRYDAEAIYNTLIDTLKTQ